jgi:hypothetical protein
MPQLIVRQYKRDGERLLRGTGRLFTEVNVISFLKRTFHGTVRRRNIKPEAWVRFEDIPSRICGGTNVEV